MKFEKLIASLLVGACGIAAVGAWFARSPEPSKRASEGKSAFSRNLMGGSGDIAIITVDGMITEGAESNSPFGGGGGATARSLIKQIKRVGKDGAKALVIQINSPGGSAAASQAIFDAVMKLKAEKKVKVVATMGDMCASGGYFIAAAADRIVASPASLTGSIGVIMHLANYEGLMGKVGVQNVTIKAGRLKDIASPDRPMTAEERALLQAIVDDTYDQFLTSVAKGRGKTVAQIKPLAEGRIYTGRQALKVGLVDQLGTADDGIDVARKLAGLPDDAKTESYGESEWDQIFKMISAKPVDPLASFAGTRSAFMSPLYNRVPLMLME